MHLLTSAMELKYDILPGVNKQMSVKKNGGVTAQFLLSAPMEDAGSIKNEKHG
jgi:hypothetical protein